MSACHTAPARKTAHPAANRRKKRVTPDVMRTSKQPALWHRAFRKHFALWTPGDVIRLWKTTVFALVAILGGPPVTVAILKALSSGL